MRNDTGWYDASPARKRTQVQVQKDYEGVQMKSSREQFEEWFPVMVDGLPENMVKIFDEMLFTAWQASRAAIEIELKQFDHFQICHYGADEKYADGYIDAQNNASKAIDFAGLKVKS